MKRTLIALAVIGVGLVAATDAHALTVQQVLDSQDAINNVRLLQKRLEAIDRLDAKVDMEVVVPYQNYLIMSSGMVSSSISGGAGGCGSCGGGSGGGGAKGPDPKEALRTTTFSISRQTLHDQMQAQIDECMAKLNKLGITP